MSLAIPGGLPTLEKPIWKLPGILLPFVLVQCQSHPQNKDSAVIPPPLCFYLSRIPTWVQQVHSQNGE